MFPIPPFIAEFALKYASKLIAGVIVSLLATSTYLYWSHSKIKQGADEERFRWEKRESQLISDSEKLISEKNAEIEAVKQHNQEVYTNAIKLYIKHGEDAANKLRNTPPRVRVITKQAACSGDSLQGGPKDSSGIGGTGRALDQVTELDDGVAKNLNEWSVMNDLGRADCQELIDVVKSYGLVK